MTTSYNQGIRDMDQKLNEYKTAIRDQVIKLAQKISVDATSIQSNEIIPEKGYLDSASIIELILWFEGYFNLSIDDDEITIDNFGSIDAMANFVLMKTSVR